MMKLGLTPYLLALLLALSWACGGPRDMLISPQDTPSPTQTPMSAAGQIWVLETLNGAPVIEGTELTLSIGETDAGGLDGCNSFFGSHEDGSLVARSDGTISFPGFGRTLAMCGLPPQAAQSDSYRAALADGTEYQILGNRLEIRDSSGKVRLVMINKSPLVGEAVDLTGTAWRLVSFDGKSPRGIPPTLAFWDERFVGGTVDGYGFAAQYDKWKASFRVRTITLTEAGTTWGSRILDQDVRDFLLGGIGRSGGYAVREEEGTRLLRIRTGGGAPLDFKELMPMVDNISGTEWRLKSFIEVREGENRAGGPPCIENVLHGANIVARFTEMSVSGTAGSMEYSHDNLNLSVVRPGESVADGSDDKDTDLPRGRCPGEDSEKADVRDVAGQAERYLELLTQLRRYMIFGDRLVVLTDSQQALLFQADGVGMTLHL